MAGEVRLKPVTAEPLPMAPKMGASAQMQYDFNRAIVEYLRRLSLNLRTEVIREIEVGGGTPGGLDTYVQYNDSGVFGGEATFVYNKSTDTLTVTNIAGSGAALTNLNAGNLASGTVPTARLGTGTANSTTFLRGDQTWAVPPGSSGGEFHVLFTGGPNTLTTTTVGTTDQTFATTYTLPANTLQATNDCLRITFIIEDNFPQGGAEVVARLRVGGATIVSPRRGVVAAAVNNVTVITVMLYRRGTNLLEATAFAVTGRPGDTNNLTRMDQGSGTVDFTSNQVIDINADLVVQASGTATSILRLLVVEKIVPN